MKWLPGFIIDLRCSKFVNQTLEGLFLANTVFDGSDFHGAKLISIDAKYHGGNWLTQTTSFRRCNFRKARILCAEIWSSEFFDASFDQAEIQIGSCRRTDFSHVNFNGALIAGNFNRAVFARSNFRDAHLVSAEFIDCDLSTIKNLATVKTASDVVLDHRTLVRSGKLEDEFYRKCGLTQPFIDYLPSILNVPIQLYSCFISYSAKDEQFVKRLYADLCAANVRCWYAPRDLRIGDRQRESIDQAVRLHDKLLVVLSRASTDSTWVEFEVETALEEEARSRRTVLFPIRIDDSIMTCGRSWAALMRRTRNIGDFRKWKQHNAYEEAFSKLLSDLSRTDSPSQGAAAAS